mgnify:CR=1 FL=1
MEGITSDKVAVERDYGKGSFVLEGFEQDKERGKIIKI